MGGFYIGFPLSTDVGSVSVDQIRSKRGCLSYIVYDRQSKEAAIIDPSLEVGAARYCRFLSDLEVKLHYIIDTHTHADHISATREIRDACGGKIVMHKRAPASSVDLRVCDSTKLSLGETTLFVFETPGHTPDSISITCALSEGLCVFTGDTLLIESVGRTDLQGGNSACLACLYESLWRQLLLLPDSTIVYPGHDYKGYLSTTIGRAKRENPKLQLSRSEFISFMDNYHPPKPELYDNAVVVNSR